MKKICKDNLPIVSTAITGLFYLILGWNGSKSLEGRELFFGLTAILPGFTFPITTTYFNLGSTIQKLKIGLHLLYSVALYYGIVWLTIASKDGALWVLVGLIGSLLYLIPTKLILKKKLTYLQIFIGSILSGLIYLPTTFLILSKDPLYYGILILLWTVINGVILNIEYRRSITDSSKTVLS